MCPPVVIRDHQEWLLEDLLGSWWHYRILQYRVSWVRHYERTWEQWYHMRNYIYLPGSHGRYPRNPGLLRPDTRAPLGLELDAFSLLDAR